MAQVDKWSLPDVELRWENPDIILVRCLSATVGEETLRQFLELHSEFYARAARPRLLIDIKTGGLLNAQARREVIRFKLGYRYSSITLCGGSAIARSMAALIIRGITLVGLFGGKVSQHSTEEEARRWIDDQRRSGQMSASL